MCTTRACKTENQILARCLNIQKPCSQCQKNASKHTLLDSSRSHLLFSSLLAHCDKEPLAHTLKQGTIPTFLLLIARTAETVRGNYVTSLSGLELESKFGNGEIVPTSNSTNVSGNFRTCRARRVMLFYAVENVVKRCLLRMARTKSLLLAAKRSPNCNR